MNKRFIKGCVAVVAGLVACVSSSAANSDLLTKRWQQPTGSAGNNHSSSAFISADGRYVAFVSGADNLVTNSLGQPLPTKSNVFLRDRLTQKTTLVSVDTSGVGGGNGDSFPAGLSSDGRYVLLESSASNLVAGDTNNASDVFVRDVVSGTTALVSVATDGGFGDRDSRGAMMTADGRFVTFVSAASNLVTNDSNGINDVFVRDMLLGTTVLASPGATTGFRGSVSPTLTPDGRFVALMSFAVGPTNYNASGRVYLRDVVNAQTLPVGTNVYTAASNYFGGGAMVGYGQVISDDGRYVAFELSLSSGKPKAVVARWDATTDNTDIIATNAVATLDYETSRSLDMTPDGRFVVYSVDANNGGGTRAGIYRWDAQSNTTNLVTADLNGAPSLGLTAWPTIDATGRYVTFYSTATNLAVNAPVGGFGLYLRDMVAGATTLVSPANAIVSPVSAPVMSSNAQVIAYDSTGLVSGGDPNQADVFVRDLSTNATELISVRDAIFNSITPSGPSAITSSCLSSNGRYFAFSSRADDLVTNDSNRFRDVFVQDRVGGGTLLVSVNTNGVAGNGPSTDASISANGRFVAFVSAASDLIAKDTNGVADIFVRDLASGTTALVSQTSDGAIANRASSQPMISQDGRYVLFHSQAVNLQPGSSGLDNLYLRDTQLGTTTPLTSNNTSTVFGTISPGGRFLAYMTVSNSFSALAVVDLVGSQPQLVGLTPFASSPTVAGIAVSADGSRAAVATNSAIFVVNVQTGTTTTITNTSTHGVMRFSADGRWLVYARTNVYAVDLQNGTQTVLTAGYDGSAANNTSDFPDISADGRFVTFVSSASNLVPNDSNNLPDVFLYDLTFPATNGNPVCVSASCVSGASADGRSMTPYFSPDGKTLAFESWAGDIVTQDLNQSGDLFAFNVATVAPVYPGDPVLMFETAVDFAGMTTANGGVTFSWMVDPTRVYKVQFKDDLNEPVWQDFGGATAVIGSTEYAQDVAGTSQRFYRVVVQ
jgi:Tol biopolymer transport system component